MLAQADFSALELAVEQDSIEQPLDDFNGYASIERASASEDKQKSESACQPVENFSPVHFITDEEYELIIRCCDRSCLKQQESSQASIAAHSFGKSRSSHKRCIPESAPPPKLFYRTFWRSVTRRMVRRQMEKVVKQEEL